jgi:cytochrome c
MLDTMTVTKAAGALFGMWLILLLGKWAAEGLYHVGGEGEEQAYSIAVEESGGEEEAEDAVPFEEVFASADAADGEGLFRACQSCHKLDGSNGTGPHLDGVVNRDIGAVEGFSYSETLASMEGDWTPEALSGFLENPRGYAEGTKMSYAGMKDVEDRANLIAYLQSTGG